MNNRDLEAAWSYHNSTKHSLWTMYNDPHHMDFDNQPIPFKIYSDLEPIALPHDIPLSESGAESRAFSAISTVRAHPGDSRPPDLETLASLFLYSSGITKRAVYPAREMQFRAAACTGALYHIELYLVCGDLPGLKAGVYHYGAHDSSLRRLREGDHRSTLVRATGTESSMVDAPAAVVCTGTFWRNAWKYRARTYRHCYWDSGTILANLLAICAALGLPARVLGGFVDESVNRLLGLDTQREVSLSLVTLGHDAGPPAGPAPEAPPLTLETVRLSRSEVDYPAIRAIHEASALSTEEETASWRAPTPIAPIARPSGQLFPLRALGDHEVGAESIGQVIQRRGSTRQFVHSSITFAQLSTILHGATRGVPADFLNPVGTMLNDLYLIVNAVDDLPAGAYVFRRDQDALELLEEGDFRQVAGGLGLQQALPADAAVDVFFLTNLDPILRAYGNRGYRAAQLEAGIIGGKLYLGAYALRLGATGLTFFDDDVTTFFSPHADGKSVMFLVALGKPLRRRTVRQG